MSRLPSRLKSTSVTLCVPTVSFPSGAPTVSAQPPLASAASFTSSTTDSSPSWPSPPTSLLTYTEYESSP